MILRKKNSGVTNEIRIRRCYGCGAVLQDKTQRWQATFQQSN